MSEMFDFMMDDFSGGGSYEVPSGPIVPEASDCLRCGVCLNSCPTYQLDKEEQEGPRQRIRTLSKLLVEAQTVDAEALEHLNNCTQCRACESVCPSQMSYSELFDKAQHHLAKNTRKGFYGELALHLVEDKKNLKRVLPLIRFYHFSGARWLAQNSGLLKLLKLDLVDKLARQPAKKNIEDHSATTKQTKGKVALFTGCISADFDRQTLTATMKLINALGYDVTVPDEQVCCGAIHYHNGQPETAKSLMQANRNCFNRHDVTAIVYCATGCGSQLEEYQQSLALTDYEAAFQPDLYEVSNFILENWDDDLVITPLSKKIAVHEPCSHRNVLKNQRAIYELLAKIPNLQITALEDNHLCCGSGGTYMLTHPEKAQALRDNKWQHIRASQADVVVTTNIGCEMHLQTALAEQDKVEMMHPVTLLANQL